MSSIFGTDGVRGLANADLTAELALDLAVAAAHELSEHAEFTRTSTGRPTAVVGRDPRASGEFLEAAIVAGLASAGVDVLRLGVLPTPGIAHLTDSLDASFGVVITASHNPAPDNGIKFLARGGRKLDDALERAIEARMREPWERPTGAGIGRIAWYDAAVADYVRYLESTLTSPLSGLTVVLDCAHGAASHSGPEAFRAAGAEVIAIGNHPDGLNINDGVGSTHLESLRAAVIEHGADAGFAFDGDADRCLAVDAEGSVVDGDQILAMLAVALRDQGALPHDTVVATVMSNLGFFQAMSAAGINVVQTAVGDRYVLEAMHRDGFGLGGEQSGHVILAQYATTGDGTLTALHVAQRMASTGRSLKDLASVVAVLPQVLVNVPGVDKAQASLDEGVAAAVAEAETELGDGGRVLLRPSGTEPLVRVMVEAPTRDQAQTVADRLADVVRARLSL